MQEQLHRLHDDTTACPTIHQQHAGLQSWLACGGDDGRVSVYDTSRPDVVTADRLPAQLVVQHVGHLGNIMDAQWSPYDPFLMMSVSNDGHTYKEGGACQMWRLSWLLYTDLAEAEQRLSGYQQWLVRVWLFRELSAA